MRGARKASLKRFPYVVIFQEHEESVLVVGVMHGRSGRGQLYRRLLSR
jgi:hypothetical protein